MSFDSELHDLLEEAADRLEPDPAVLAEAERRASATLRARRRGWALAAAAVVAVVAVVGTALGRGPAPEPPVIVDQPSPQVSEHPTETESPQVSGEVGPELTLAEDGSIEGLVGVPQRGVLVQVDDRVVLVGLDGGVLGHLEGQLIGQDTGDPTGLALPGLQSLAHLPAVTVDGSGDVWIDPIDAAWQPAYLEAPLRGGERVVYDVDQAPQERMQLYGASPDGSGPGEVMARWPEDGAWWLSSDHRVVTWRSCSDDPACPHEFWDTDMGGRGELAPGCWAANVFGDFALTEICNGGTVVATSLGPDRTEYPVPMGTDAQQATAVAAFDGGIVRVDHVSCHVVQPMRIVEGQGLVALLGGASASSPSAIPLGTTEHLEVVLHFNAAACDATDQNPGVYVYSPDTGQRRLVYGVTAHPGQVQMWTPAADVALNGTAPPRQTPADAARDGVLPAVAALSFDQRVLRVEHDRTVHRRSRTSVGGVGGTIPCSDVRT